MVISLEVHELKVFDVTKAIVEELAAFLINRIPHASCKGGSASSRRTRRPFFCWMVSDVRSRRAGSTSPKQLDPRNKSSPSLAQRAFTQVIFKEAAQNEPRAYKSECR